ncbi:MAG: hypothetical protein ACRESR_06475 [Gammaproteobacteria bacterium]
MKTLTVCVMAALAVSGVASAYAGDANKNVVTRDYTDTVAPAQQAAYEAGVKSFIQCLRQHDFKYSVMAVTHQTGSTYMYSFELGPATWADFDAMRTSAGACGSVAESDMNPHLKSEISAFIVTKPGFSRMPKDMTAYALVDVIHFTLKPGMAAQKAFTDAVKEIYAAEDKANWPVYSTTGRIEAGGPGAPDYELDVFYKNWASFGSEPNPPLWKMVASVYGQQKADGIRHALDGAIASTEEHVDRFDPGLSYIAGK